VIFHGVVDDIGEDTFFAFMKPDDGGEDEVWEIERKHAPYSWLSPGALFTVQIEENGVNRWTFENSIWTKEAIAEIETEAEKFRPLWQDDSTSE
jgi:hypothetical protein